MAFRLHRNQLPAKAASSVNAGDVVGPLSGATEASGAVTLQVVKLASSNLFPIGVALATGASPGVGVTVLDSLSVAAVTVVGSVGIGGEVGVASTNGGIAPVAGASGSLVYSLGVALSNGLAGETVSVYIRPRALSGTP